VAAANFLERGGRQRGCGTALEGGPDVRLDDRGRQGRLDGDLVAHAGDARQVAHAVARVLTLVLPFDVTRQGQPAPFDHHLDGVWRQGTGPAQDVLGRLRNVGIGALAELRQLDLQFDGQGLDTADALSGALGVPLLDVAADLAVQRHHAVLHLDADLLGMHCRFPLQFCHHVLLQLRIGLHGCCTAWLRKTRACSATSMLSVRHRTAVPRFDVRHRMLATAQFEREC